MRCWLSGEELLPGAWSKTKTRRKKDVVTMVDKGEGDDEKNLKEKVGILNFIYLLN